MERLKLATELKLVLVGQKHSAVPVLFMVGHLPYMPIMFPRPWAPGTHWAPVRHTSCTAPLSGPV